METPELLWTVAEFAEWLRITPMAVRAMLKRGDLPREAILKIGRRVRIRAQVIQDWVFRRQAA